MKATTRSLALASLFALAAPPAQAGVEWVAQLESEEKTDPPFLRTVRILSDRMRVDGGQQRVIVRLDSGLIWSIDLGKKSYQELRFDDLGAAIARMEDFIKNMPDEKKAIARDTMKKLVSPMTRIEVTPTGEKKTIAGHPCTVFTIKGGPVQSSICAASDLPPSPDALAFYAAMAERMAKTPGLESLRSQAEAYSKLAGVVVEERSRVASEDGERVEVYTFQSYTVKDIPVSEFELPADLTKQPSPFDQLIPAK